MVFKYDPLFIPADNPLLPLVEPIDVVFSITHSVSLTQDKIMLSYWFNVTSVRPVGLSESNMKSLPTVSIVNVSSSLLIRITLNPELNECSLR